MYGLVRSKERLIQVLSADNGAGALQRLGRVSREPACGSVALPLAGGAVHLTPVEGVPPIGVVEVMSLHSLDSRRAGILGEAALSGKRVGLVGCGSVGSAIAVELAKAGVGRFLAVDPASLDVPNVSRHACCLRHVGRQKAVALADVLHERGASAVPIVSDLSDNGAAEALRDTDLLVVATDSPRVQFRMNEMALEYAVTAIFPQAYERACGGEVFILTPGQGPCLFCATGFRAGVSEAPFPVGGGQAYQSADANQLTAEPGLGVDISYLAAVAASYALAALLPSGSRKALLADDKRLVLVHGGSQPQEEFAEIFRRPFEHLAVGVNRPEPCPVCGWSSSGEEKAHVVE